MLPVLGLFLSTMILVGARLLATHPLDRRFWIIVFAMNGFMLAAWFAIDVWMDNSIWDHLDKNGYDALLMMLIFLWPATAGAAYFLFWSRKK